MFSAISNIQTTSEQIYDSVINSVTKVINREIQNCSSYTQNDQIFEIGGTNVNITGGIRQTQKVQVNINCVQNININTDIINNIVNDIEQSIETKFADSAGFNFVKTDGVYQSTIANIRIQLSNVVTNETLQDCSNQINQLQIFRITPSAKDINISGEILQYQTYTAYADCLQKKITNTTIQNDIQNLVSQISKFEQDSFITALTYLAIVVAVILAIVGGMYFTSVYFRSRFGGVQKTEREAPNFGFMEF